jgi:hypothetical protein
LPECSSESLSLNPAALLTSGYFTTIQVADLMRSIKLSVKITVVSAELKKRYLPF